MAVNVPASGSRPLIRTLHRALWLVETIAAHSEGITLAQLKRETHLHPSTIFHLLRTMVALGFVSQDRTTKTYRLGPKVFQLATSRVRERQLTEMAAPFLQFLAHKTREGASLAVRENDHAVIIARVDGTGRLQVVDRVGDADPLYCTAVGKVLLAFAQPNQDALIAGIRFQRKTPKTITNRTDLDKEIRRVRAQGYAVDDEELTLGVRCLAVPVFDAEGRIAAAIAVRGPAVRFTRSRIPPFAKHVVEAGRRLSRHLCRSAGGAKPATLSRQLDRL